MSASPPLIGADDVVLSKEELVRFDNVQATYRLDKAVHLKYTLGSFVHASPRDWIGLFPIEWQNTLNPVLFQQAAPKPKYKSKKRSSTRRAVWFSVNNLREAVVCGNQSYQFVYVTTSSDVIGLSGPFVFQWEDAKIKSQNHPKMTLTKPVDGSEESSLNTDFSVITPGKELPQSECPVLVSSSCENSDEESWDSIHSLGNMSHISSEIEILSTSPSQDGNLTSHIGDIGPEVASLSGHREDESTVPNVLNNEETVQELTAFTRKSANLTDACPKSTTNGLSIEAKVDKEDHDIDASANTLDDKTVSRLNCSEVRTSTGKSGKNKKNNLGLKGYGRDAFKLNQLSPACKKIIKEQLCRKQKQQIQSEQKKACHDQKLSMVKKGEESSVSLFKIFEVSQMNSETIKMERNDGIKRVCQKIKESVPPQIMCENSGVRSVQDVGSCQKTDLRHVSSDKTFGVYFENSPIVNAAVKISNKSDGTLSESPIMPLQHSCSTFSTPFSSNDQSDTTSLQAEKCQASDAKRAGIEIDGCEDKHSKKSQKKKKRKLQLNSDHPDSPNCIDDKIRYTFDFSKPIHFDGIITPDGHDKKNEGKGVLEDTLGVSSGGMGFEDGRISPEGSTSDSGSREADNNRTKHITKTTTLIRNKLKKPPKEKVKRGRKALLENSKTILQTHNSTAKQKQEDTTDDTFVPKIEEPGNKIDVANFEPLSQTQSTKPSFLATASEPQSLSSVLKVWDPFCPSIQRSRPHVPGYMLDVMDALPTIKHGDGNALRDWHKSLVPHKASQLHKQVPKSGVNDQTLFGATTSMSKDNKLNNGRFLGCLNESYADVVKIVDGEGKSAHKYIDVNVSQGKMWNDGPENDDDENAGNEEESLSTEQASRKYENGRTLGSYWSKVANETALDMQISLLQKVDQNHKNRLKNPHNRRLRASKADLRIRRAKRLRKQLDMARRKKQNCNMASTEFLLCKGSDSDTKDMTDKRIVPFDLTNFARHENLTVTLNWPLPTFVKPENKFLSLTPERLAWNRTDEQVDPRNRIHVPICVRPARNKGNNLEDVDDEAKLAIRQGRGHDHESRELLNMALGTSLEENHRLRQESMFGCGVEVAMIKKQMLGLLDYGLRIMSRRLDNVEKQLALANIECRKLRKAPCRQDLSMKTMKVRRQALSGIAKMQMDKLKSQLQDKSREIVSLQNEVNVLREQLRKKDNSPQVVLDITSGHAVVEVEDSVNCGVQFFDLETEIDFGQPVSKKRKLDEDNDVAITTTVEDRNLEAINQQLKSESWTQMEQSLYVDIQREHNSFFKPMTPPHTLVTDVRENRHDQEIRKTSVRNQPPVIPFTVHRSSHPSREVSAAEDLSCESVCANSPSTPSMVSSVGIERPRATHKDGQVWTEPPTFQSMPKSRPLNRFPFLQNPRSSPALTIDSGPDTSGVPNHKGPDTNCFQTTQMFAPMISPRNAYSPTPISPISQWNTRKGTASCQAGFGSGTATSSNYGLGSGRRRSPTRIKPFIRHPASMPMASQERKAKNGNGNRGLFPYPWGQTGLKPQQWPSQRETYLTLPSQEFSGPIHGFDPGHDMPRQELGHNKLSGWKCNGAYSKSYMPLSAVSHGNGPTSVRPDNAIARDGNTFQPGQAFSRGNAFCSPEYYRPPYTLNFATTPSEESYQSAFHQPVKGMSAVRCQPPRQMQPRPYQPTSGQMEGLCCPSFRAQRNGKVIEAHDAYTLPQTSDNLFHWGLSPASCDMQRPGLSGMPPMANILGEYRPVVYQQDPYMPSILPFNHPNSNGNHVANTAKH